LAALVGCAKSHLSMLENEVRRGGGVSREILIRLEDALGITRGVLVRAAHWENAPGEVRLDGARIEAATAVARELGALRGVGSLDEAFRSGRLAKLIARIDPEAGAMISGAAARRGGDAGDVGQPTGTGSRRDGGAIERDGVLASLALPVEVPLINSVAAGYPGDFSDLGYPARVADEYVRSPDIRDPDAFAARVVGESMLPEYREGDLVIFSPSKPVRSGQDCFVRVEPDHQTTFKRVFFETADGRTIDEETTEPGAARAERVRLQPLNPKFRPMTLAREDVAGVYAAVSVMRTIG
ncbi:MAG: LexA family transcriptional regulator, partial [Phycisphaerales bacterium]|nr:LexA family transcriptional regulator [Phycisphaerales bacterium]